MKSSSTAHRVAVFLAGVAVLASLSGIAEGATSTSKPSGMSEAEYRAVTLRGEALNEKYRLGAWKGVPAGMTAAQYRALKIRGDALNKKYGLGRWSASAAAQSATDKSDGFAWGAFGIGAAAMLGLALLAAGAIGGRHYTRVARIRTS